MADLRVKNDQGHELVFDGDKWVDAQAFDKRGMAAAAAAPVDLLQSTSSLGKFGEGALVSAGDQFATMGRNIRDVYAQIRGDVDSQLKIADERKEADRIRANLHGEAPVGSVVGAMLPTAPLMILGSGAPAALMARAGVSAPAALSASIGGGAAATGLAGIGRVAAQQALLGAAQGALQSQSGDFGTDAALGGAISGGMSLAGALVGRVQSARAQMAEEAKAAAAGGGTGRTVMGQPSQLTSGEQDIIDGAKRAGLQLMPGQESGIPMMRKIDASLSANPLTSKVFDDIEQANKAQINRLAARAMGIEGADNVGSTVMMNAEEAIGRQFEEVGKKLGRVDLDPLINDVSGLAEQEMLSGAPRMEIKGILNNLLAGQKNRAAAVGADEGRFITGEQMMQMRSQLSTKMRDAFNSGNSARGQLYGDVLEVYDKTIADAAAGLAGRAGVPPAQAAKEAEQVMSMYSTARDRWNVWRALDRGGATEEGNVFASRFANNLERGDKSGYAGRVGKDGQRLFEQGSGTIGENPIGDLYDALRFKNSQIGKPIVPNTGGTVGTFNNFLNGGGVVGTAAKVIGGKLMAEPIMKAYANQSPLASQAMATTMAMMKGGYQMPAGFAMAQQAARTGQAAMGGASGLGM